MGQRRLLDQQAGFSSGLNITSDPAFLRPDQARQMANLRLSNFGAALKRLGTQVVSSAAITTFDTTNSVYGGLYWPLQGKILVSAAATNSTAIHLYSTTYGSFPRTWTDLGALPQYRGVVFTDNSTAEVVYFAGNLSPGLYKYNNSAISAIASATDAYLGVCVYNDRLWAWGGAAGVGVFNYLYYSNLSSPAGSTGGDSLGDTAAGGGFIIVRTFGASDIVACAPVNGSLLIFHEQGISVLTGWGQDDVQVQPQALNATIGMGNATPDGICVANELSTGDLAYFVTPVGLYMTNGGFVRPVGSPDKPDPTAALLAAGSVTLDQFIVRFNRQFNEVWVGIKGTGVYIYNVILGAWSGPFTGTYASGLRQLFEVVDTSGNPHLWRVTYNGAPGSGVFVSESDRAATYKDDVVAAGTGGTAVTASLQFHRMFTEERVYAKSWRWVNLMATLTASGPAPTMVCTTQVNGSNTFTLSNLTALEQPYYVKPGGTGLWMDVTVNDAVTGGTSQYAMATIESFFLGRR